MVNFHSESTKVESEWTVFDETTKVYGRFTCSHDIWERLNGKGARAFFGCVDSFFFMIDKIQ